MCIRDRDYVAKIAAAKMKRSKVTARVALDEVATWLVQGVGKPDMTMDQNEDGTSTVDIGVPDEKTLYRWLLTLTTHAKILSPQSLVSGYREFLIKVRDSWRT